ncbi:uncharacterized protein [Rutidosis leptorrhynchoides]|uniref:uncharacterized protein n=1 Tax=Rutidosis leptorrhynchoides TaxID=125765 RepID=UPI003A99604E
MADKFHPALSVTNIKNMIPITLNIDNAQYSSWAQLFKTHYNSRLDAIVLQWIYGTISIAPLENILEDESTAANVWIQLENIFQDNKNIRALYLQRQFSKIRLDDFSNCAAYCQQIKVLVDQLRNVGVKVTDDRMVLQLVVGLNDNFDTVGTYITQKSKLPSFYEARSKLILEETRKQKQVSHISSTTDSALIATTAKLPDSTMTDSSQTSDTNRTNHPQFRYNSNRGRGMGSNNYRGQSNRGRGMNFSPNVYANQWNNPPNWAYSPPNWAVAAASPWATPPCPYPSSNWVRPNSLLYHLSPPSTFTALSSNIWHHLLGHPGNEVLRSLSNKQFISCNKQLLHSVFQSYVFGK